MHSQQVQDLAAYNQWMNTKIYDACESLTDEQRKQDMGGFFKSIHGALNHLLLGDKIWLGRFTGEPFAVAGLDQELFKDFNELKQVRQQTDQQIINWVAALTEAELLSKLQYQSIVDPATRSYEMWLAITHFFNHQTHHRGQVTALLSQLGVDYGVTDLIWLPQIIERNAQKADR